MEVFRIDLMEEPKLVTKQKHSQDSQLFTLLSFYDIEHLFILRLRKSIGRGLKNHYIVSRKTSINKGKNTYKK